MLGAYCLLCLLGDLRSNDYLAELVLDNPGRGVAVELAVEGDDAAEC